MSSIDERIVAMKFNNSQFQKGVADTTKSLDDLKKGLNLSASAKGLNDLNAAGKSFSLSNIANGIETITSKFGALAIVGITALTNIANKAVDAGLTLAKSLTIDPIKAGFDEYELKMGSIQTILANTSRYGTSLEEVTANLDELNEYADKTIYNFGDMTKNIGLFTNAGLRIEDATSMIKGFSNEAAASGTSAQGAAGAAYQLSQALSAGTIRLMDWRSLTNVGMGNKNMQNGLIEIADAMGTLEASSISATDVQADFNGSLEKNWLSADVMSSYLKIMAGDMTDAEQAALGLSDAQIAAFSKQAQTAEEAATKVRTWSQLVGTLQEGVGSAWAQTFDILIGDFNEATELFSAVSDALGTMIGESGNARNKLLEEWKSLGGRDSAIQAVANAWQAAMKILEPIKEAFREIFPPMTAQQLVDITKAVENFTKSLIPSEKTMENIKDTAKGFFAVLDIGWMVLQQVIGLFGRLFGVVAPASGGILEFTGNIGEFLVKVRDAIKNGDGLGKVFQAIGDALETPIKMLGKLGDFVGGIFQIENFAEAWDNVSKALQKVGEFLQPVGDWIVRTFKTIKDAVTKAFEAMDFNILLGLLNTGILGGIFLVIKKFVDGIPGLFSGLGGGIFETIKGAFTELTNTMEAMQSKLKAEALLKIAGAIGLLTAAVVALSFVDTGKLFISLGAMTVMAAQLSGIMLAMDKMVMSKGFLKMPALTFALIGISAAMVIFSAAVLIMSQLDWDELAVGMTGMAAGLGVMVGALAVMTKITPALKGAAPTLFLLSTSMVILASAMKIFSSLSWDDIGRSMTAFAGGLATLAVGSKLIQGSIAGAGAMVIVATAVTILSGAMKVFATMSWDEIGRSLVVLAGALTIVTVAMQFMTKNILGAGAMVIVAGAIVTLSGAFKVFATMSWDEIGRALTLLGGGLGILAAAMALMGIPLVLAGSVGLLASGVALMALAPALVLLSTVSWDSIGAGLTLLGGGLAILAVGGVLLLPAIPAFLALGIAAGLIGVGALAAGVGLGLMGAGLLAIATAAMAGSEAMKVAANTLVSIIPDAMQALAEGLIEFAKTLANGGAELTEAFAGIILSFLDALKKTGPEIINTMATMLLSLIKTMESKVPSMVDSGLKLVNGILSGMAANIGETADIATDLIVNFLNAVGRNLPRIVSAGMNMIINFVNGLAIAIRINSGRMADAGWNLARAIIDGMVGGIGNGVWRVIDAARRMAQNALNAAMRALGINSPSKEFFKLGEFSDEGMANGFDKKGYLVENAAQNVANAALSSVKDTMSGLGAAIESDVDMSPTIKPMMDLSEIQKGTAALNGMFTPQTISVSESTTQARNVSNLMALPKQMPEGFDPNTWVKEKPQVVYNQYNNSPKALSEIEIYRQTKNQISTVKEALDV